MPDNVLHKTVDVNATDVLARALAALDEKYDLVYVSQGDRMSPEQLQHVFEHGEDDPSYYEWRDDAVDQGAEEAAREVLRGLRHTGDEVDLFEGSDEWDQLVDAIKDRDDSTDYADLLRGSGNVPLRYNLGANLGEDGWDLPPDSWRWSDRRVRAGARLMARLAGISFADNEAALVELVQESSSGGLLYVLWYGPPTDLVMATFQTTDEGFAYLHDGMHRTISWTDPHLLLLNPWNGSGHDVKVTGTITKPWTRERVCVDNASTTPGYSWEQVCGPHWPAYANTCTIEPPVRQP